MKLAFLWHWQKKTLPHLRGAFAAEDTLIKAIGRLTSEGEDAMVFAIGPSEYVRPPFLCDSQNVWYRLCPNREQLVDALADFDPHVVIMSHEPKDYDDVLEAVQRLSARKIMFYSAPITPNEITRQFDAFFVHHAFQGEVLAQIGYSRDKVVVAPKTADLDVFCPAADEVHRWDCIYPSRGGFGYWKRIEMAVEACRLAGKTLVVPGGRIPGTLDCGARAPGRLIERRLPARLSDFTMRYRRRPFPWLTTLAWQTAAEMAERYNQSRCFVITSNEREMGPRVIPEAAACNLPLVCCSDSPACVSYTEKLGGFIADPNPKDVAAKILQALAAPSATRESLLAQRMDSWVIYRVLKDKLDEWSL